MAAFGLIGAGVISDGWECDVSWPDAGQSQCKRYDWWKSIIVNRLSHESPGHLSFVTSITIPLHFINKC
jgi:hypothetical protein